MMSSVVNTKEGVSRAKPHIASLVAALMVCLFAGFGYAWSVVQTPIATAQGWSDAGISLAFTITVCGSTLSPLFLGKWIQKMPVRRTVIIGAALYGVGLFTTGLAASLWQLYLFYGVFAGVGCGMIYPTMMSYVVRLFPEKSGLVSGLGTAFYGAGAIVWAPTMVSLINAISLSMAFHVLGLSFAAAIILASMFLREPATASTGEAQKEGRPTPQNGLRRGEMVKTARFYITVVAFSLGLTAGLMIISQASPILQQSLQFTPARAAVFVSIFAGCNMLGRFVWGALSDKIGLFASMAGLFSLAILAMALLAVIQVQALMLVCMGIAASCYGGLASVLTPLTAKLFGPRYITENYGVMYIAFGISSLLAPNLAIQFLNATGAYMGAYIAAAAFALVGLILSRILAAKAKQQVNSQ